MDFEKDRIIDVSSRSDAMVQGFMQKVYLWMTMGLAVTGAASYFVTASPAVMGTLFGRSIVPLVIIAAVEIGIVFYLSARVMTLNPATASTLFFVYSALNGLTLAPIFLIYTSESVATTFFVTAGVFGSMSVYGYVTKRDLTDFGSFLRMGLWGIIIAMLVNMFVRSTKMGYVISGVAVVVFTGIAAYDTYKLRKIAAEGSFGDDARDNLAVLGALTLYLDFVNLFLHLLRFMGKRR